MLLRSFQGVLPLPSNPALLILPGQADVIILPLRFPPPDHRLQAVRVQSCCRDIQSGDVPVRACFLHAHEQTTPDLQGRLRIKWRHRVHVHMLVTCISRWNTCSSTSQPAKSSLDSSPWVAPEEQKDPSSSSTCAVSPRLVCSHPVAPPTRSIWRNMSSLPSSGTPGEQKIRGTPSRGLASGHLDCLGTRDHDDAGTCSTPRFTTLNLCQNGYRQSCGSPDDHTA